MSILWLGDEKFMEYASKLTPKSASGDTGRSGGLLVPGKEETYLLELTPEQNENYADAKFYILEQQEEVLQHRRKFVSGNKGPCRSL